MEKIKLVFSTIRLLPHLIVIYLHPRRKLLKIEYKFWIQTLRINYKGIVGFIFLLTFIKEYRNVFYLRIGRLKYVLHFFAPGSSLIFIDTPSECVGSGLVFQHGFSSIINAKSIGNNCQIWHNVTIGKSKSGTNFKPVIGNNVKISAGAIVLGEIFIGDNATIGAGAVVTKNVPADSIVVGNPAAIISINGMKISRSL